MPVPFCHCQCKMCRAPGVRHCLGHPSCGTPWLDRQPGPGSATVPRRPDEKDVVGAMRRLRAESGSHAPSVAQIERAIPGLVQVDACFLSNPYATNEVVSRLLAVPAPQWQQMVAHYPSQASVIASTVAPHLGVPAENLHLGNGACEVIQAVLADRFGSLLISMPTFSAYYEFAKGPVVAHQLDPRCDFRLDLHDLEAMVTRHSPETVVIINPNNPDGGMVPHADLVGFLRRVHASVDQVIVDESFSHFASDAAPQTAAGMVGEFPNLVVVNSLSKNYGIPGLRLGYAVMSAQRVKALRDRCLWNLNALAEWFATLLGDPEFQQAYELARRRYIRDTRTLLTELATLRGARVFPSAANFALLELDRSAAEVTSALLTRHGVYVRDCADKRGLHGGHRFIRVAARSQHDNRRIINALHDVLSQRALTA
jgi:histidinol-phosphate/aromatic aminotransferase/cobyric acid decarboxylase-like protein